MAAQRQNDLAGTDFSLRVAAQQPVTASSENIGRAMADALKRAWDNIGIDMFGRVLKCTIENPLYINVGNDRNGNPTIWSFGFWESNNGGRYLLIRVAEVSSFTRAQADGYIAISGISPDIPTT